MIGQIQPISNVDQNDLKRPLLDEYMDKNVSTPQSLRSFSNQDYSSDNQVNGIFKQQSDLEISITQIQNFHE